MNETYDYIVVGGGTAGLCVAARLTENPEVKVAVLEAGSDRMDDPQVYTPSLYPTLIGREKYDWCYQSVPQPNAANKSYSMPRGRLLGGSSGINYLMYVRGSKADYDGWESLGNKGWGWEGMVPYFRKHQTLDPLENAPKNPQFMPHAEKEKWHGSDGPIHTSFNDHYEVCRPGLWHEVLLLTLWAAVRGRVRHFPTHSMILLTVLASVPQHTKLAASLARSRTPGLETTWVSTRL